MGLCFIRSWPAGIGFANRWELVDVRINPFIVGDSFRWQLPRTTTRERKRPFPSLEQEVISENNENGRKLVFRNTKRSKRK